MTAPHVGIDTTVNLTPHLPMLAREGVRYASRYLRAAGIKKAEADAIRAYGINLILNYEGAGDRIAAFSAEAGRRDATYAMGQAQLLGAPDGTAIYFSCEPDPKNGAFSLTADYTNRVLPYWRACRQVFGTKYRIGAYSFGTWLGRLLDDSATDFAWLPNASGWSGYTAFLNSGRWHYHQRLPSNVNFHGCQVDWDDVNPAFSDIGAWMAAGTPPPVTVTPPTIRKGSTGDAVKRLQTILTISADGIFGSQTERAVKFYQVVHGLTPDGVVGPLTWAKLLG